MVRDEQIGRMLMEAMAGIHGNMARDIAQAWCSIAEQKQHLLCRIKELESRLEIDKHHPIDGIAARDATIKSQDERITELEKDEARLDWIDKVGEVHICRVREGSVSGNLRWDVEYGYYGGLAKSKKGMRKAIDTAMQKG